MLAESFSQLSFCTSEFAFFFIYVFALYTILPKRWAPWILLGASYFFYGYWNWRLLGLIWISSLNAHFGARAIDKSYNLSVKKRILIGTIVFNLTILAIFKYYNFFADSFSIALDNLGFDVQMRYVKLMLPVGISFYTFQAIGYVTDVYWKKIKAEKSLFYSALFVAFFPQLVAGPIERASLLLPQLKKERQQSFGQIKDGLFLIFGGVFKKLFIADNLAVFVEKVFDLPYPNLNGTVVLLALYAFAIQIYCDFSGYTDIARGAAKCLGIELTINFKRPYFATSPKDFWRRWHITLSQWLRDYLYIPLGGNRGGTIFTSRNLLITMLLGGLWHGAAWTFVAWGAFHGLLLTFQLLFEKLTFRSKIFKNKVFDKKVFDKKNSSGKLKLPQKIWRIIIMFHAACLGWLFFRSNSIDQSWDFIVLLFTDQAIAPRVLSFLYFVIFYTWPLLAIHIWKAIRKRDDVITDLPVPIRSAVYILGFIMFVALCASDNREFMYFQF